jgi:hypothetical protein
MGYHGYIPFITEYAQNLQKVNNRKIKILEIGLLYGVTAHCITSNLNLCKVNFDYHGVDLKVRDEVKVYSSYAMCLSGNSLKLYEENSITYLANCKEKFDIILVDGDHNYATVKKECSFIKDLLVDENSLIIFDDYTGRWGNKDLFYKDRDGWQNNEKFIELENKTEKQGVGTAIDEFMEESRESLLSFALIEGEPICVINNQNKLLSLEGVKIIHGQTYKKPSIIKLHGVSGHEV